MNEQQVVALMASSKTEDEWNANCDAVKKATGGGYPEFWFRSIIMSGLCRRISADWGGDEQIHVSVIRGKP